MTPLSFKFRFVRNGQPASLLAKHGSADDHKLVLDGRELRYEDILDTTHRDNRLVILVRPEAAAAFAKVLADDHALVVQPAGVGAAQLERHVDRASSRAALERRRAALIAEGKADLFRTASCPGCHAAVDLSELPQAPYIYCRFCDSLFREGQPLPAGYRTCDECAMYDRIKGYTEFYFYFLLVIYGFSYKRRFLCDGCAGRLFWKTFLINFVFVLGVPFAIAIKVKSLLGRDPALRQLAEANSLARKGLLQEASPLYGALQQGSPEHPGILLNQGLAHLSNKDVLGGARYLKRALQSCPNYLPAQRLLAALQS